MNRRARRNLLLAILGAAVILCAILIPSCGKKEPKRVIVIKRGVVYPLISYGTVRLIRKGGKGEMLTYALSIAYPDPEAKTKPGSGPASPKISAGDRIAVVHVPVVLLKGKDDLSLDENRVVWDRVDDIQGLLYANVRWHPAHSVPKGETPVVREEDLPTVTVE